MARIHKFYANGPFGLIHCYAAGEGPCLIMAHQSPVCGRMFEQALPRLAALGIRAVAVDTPGYGNSDVPDAPPALAEYADAFVAVLDHLGLQRANFLGHHTGAGILCNFAARYPQRVDKLILNGPPLFTADELEQFRDFELGPHAVSDDGSHLQQRWDQRVQFTPGWSDAQAMHRRLVDQLWAGDTWWYGHRAAFEYQMEPDLMILRGPALILTNTGDDLYGCAKKAHALRPDFAYAELKGGTHDIVDEQPDAWSRCVADFIDG